MSGITDPISDLLTRIRNGCMAKLPFVDIERSKFKIEILRVLKKSGYIREFIQRELHGDGRGEIRIFLKYRSERIPIVNTLVRVSRPGRRVFLGAAAIPNICGGIGIAIISTPEGVMTGKEARKRNIGGEHIANVW